MTPRASSRLRSDSTCSCQCIGTGAAVCTALEITPYSRWISTGRPVMHGSARCGQVLKVDYAKRCVAAIILGVVSCSVFEWQCYWTDWDHSTRRTGARVHIESAVCSKPPAFRLPCLSVDLVGGCCVTGVCADCMGSSGGGGYNPEVHHCFP